MKNILKYILAGTALLGAVSCGDSFFEQYPANNITEGNFYKTDDDFNQGVYSCYYKLKVNMSFFLTELAYRSDECILESMAVSTQDRYDIDNFQENSYNGILSDVWNNWYNGVYRCNDVLDHTVGKDFPNIGKYRGECLFIRSWFYFNLYRTFGTVPVTTTVVTPAKAKTIKRCTDEEMYNLLVNDLTEAAELLPVVRPAEKARVTRIAAQALLAKVYLTFGKYPEAKNIIEEAMTDGGFGMMPSTAAAFDVKNKMNKEIIFALYYNKTNDNGHGYWYSSNTPVMADIQNPTSLFKTLYDASDNRLPLINTYTKINDKLYAMNKWMDTYDATYTTQVGNDFPLIRYADLVLMYAEALCRVGDIPGAVAQLNRTRTRAGLPALAVDEVPDEDAFIQELADERGREFALEGQRWYDLVRLGLAVSYFKELGYTIDAHQLIFPIPQDQIQIVNDKSILWQNPGYGD
ncbi:MAG: RagB/SusD family nutrient uptake outer membrane protein [Candidatus Cryptobacteroides sp.]